MRKLLKGNRDEYQYFEENVKLVERYVEKHRDYSGALVMFACWVLDFFEVYPLEVSVGNVLWVDSSPYIKPLAELQDEYETFAVVVADNKRAKVFLVASSKPASEVDIKGGIKNHVKVGGWSQQRYERRRDKQLHQYAREIVDALVRMDNENVFNRIVLAGSREVLNEIVGLLPGGLSNRVVGKRVLDLGKGERYVHKEIMDAFFSAERDEEKKLWGRIKANYLKGGLAVLGMEDVLEMLNQGRVEMILVNREAELRGTRCRDCERIFAGELSACPHCGSTSVFSVDMVNEIVEFAKLTGAGVEFADTLKELRELGDIGALLRY